MDNPARISMTAFQAAERVVGKGRVFITKGRTCYHPETRSVNLATGICFSSGPADILEALHECGHAQQHDGRPVLFAFRNFRPVRRWLERDAWRRAEALARRLGLAAETNGVRPRADVSYAKARVFVR